MGKQVKEGNDISRQSGASSSIVRELVKTPPREAPASLGGVICLDFYEGQTLLSQWGNALYPTALLLQYHIFANISMSLMASSALPDSSALSITEVSAVKTFLLSIFPCILAK